MNAARLLHTYGHHSSPDEHSASIARIIGANVRPRHFGETQIEAD
jgi:hypothetical protein